MDKLDKITKRHFDRVIEIITNVHNEFHDEGDCMAALTGRCESWCNEMADATQED